MKTVRLFVLQDSLRSFIDVPYGEHAEAHADLELSGIQVYHAVILNNSPRTRKSKTDARLKQRMY